MKFGLALFIFVSTATINAVKVSGESSLRGLRYKERRVGGYDEKLGMCEGSVCGLWGDPHIITCDGMSYDCMATGLFTVMKNHLYNIQANFLPVGAAGMKKILSWEHYPEATLTNDIIIDYAPSVNEKDEISNSVPTMQFSFPDLSEHDGNIPSEKGCLVGFHYQPLNMPGQSRSVEVSPEACRKRCENVEGCVRFSYFNDGGCHMNDDASLLGETPKSWSRSVAGPVNKCGHPEKKIKKTTAESDKARLFGNANTKQKGPGCPILFYLDGELQDISNVEDNGYLYGDAHSDHSAKLEGYNRIQIVHKTESGSISEAFLDVLGQGPGELFSCNWALFVCLPADEQEQFENYSVGLFGSPDGNTKNDWMNTDGEVVAIPFQQRGKGAFDYCRKNWCVSQKDSIMTYPEGTLYNDHKCIEEEFIDFHVDNEVCVMSAEKIIAKCADKPPSLIHSCQVECCYGGCDYIDEMEEEIFSLTKLSAKEEDIIYDIPVTHLPLCNDTYKQATSTTVCPDSDEGIVKVVHHSDKLPKDEDMLYGIVIEDIKDDNIGRSVKFHVENPFEDHTDIFVRHAKKVGEFANDPVCESMPNVSAGCSVDSKEIEVGCIEFPGVEPFALVDIFFVSKEDTFIINNASPEREVEKCCKPPDVYNDESEGYSVIKYSFEIKCTCPK